MREQVESRKRFNFGVLIFGVGSLVFGYGIFTFLKSEPIAVNASAPRFPIDGDSVIEIPVRIQNRTPMDVQIVGNPQCCSSVISPLKNSKIGPWQSVVLKLNLDPRRSQIGESSNQIAIRGISGFGSFEYLDKVAYIVERKK